MAVFKNLYYPCRQCGHRNRVHPSPFEAAKLVLKGVSFPCRGCGRIMHPAPSDRPIFERARRALELEARSS